MNQLRMLFDGSNGTLPRYQVPNGFELWSYHQEDLEDYLQLRVDCGFTGLSLWTERELTEYLNHTAIVGGLLVIAESATGRLAASAGAEFGSLSGIPGSLGWVMTHENFRGLGLGKTICAAVMRRLVEARLPEMYLLTDDERLPALAVYFKLGWRPWLFGEDMEERWTRICVRLGFDRLFLKTCAVMGDPPFELGAPKKTGTLG